MAELTPDIVASDRAAPSETEDGPVSEPEVQRSASVEAKQPPDGPKPTLDDLPDYTRSLLRIRLPVVVTLARKRQPLSRIVELAPGSIIQFDKSCEETLELDVGGRSIATGEAVKVGDKFGLRITSMTLPDERFCPVKKGSPKPPD